MMFSQLLQMWPETVRLSAGDTLIQGITLNSKHVGPGDCFVALAGAQHHGALYIDEAIANGAVAILTDDAEHSRPILPCGYVPKLRDVVGLIAADIYQAPTDQLVVVGVTGTNGKTTTALLLHHMFTCFGFKTGYIGTLGCWWSGGQYEILRTTPEAPELQSIFRQMVDDGISHVFLECSSHALAQGRLRGTHFDAAVFTNLSQDHLDFHVTTQAYAQAKQLLFCEGLGLSRKPNRWAILNVADVWGARWADMGGSYQVWTYAALPSQHDLSIIAEGALFSQDGIQARLVSQRGSFNMRSSLIGCFNLENILAAVSVAHCMGIAVEDIAPAVSSFSGVPGRVEKIVNDQKLSVFVDYAHTEDALRNVLHALTNIHPRRLFVVFGCGGDRDKDKRSKMAAVVAEIADIVVLTSDNPRSEDPLAIIQDMLSGVPKAMTSVALSEINKDSRHIYAVEPDRQMAIALALQALTLDDVLLVAGKGHETYQEIKGIRYPFDDRVVIKNCLQHMESR